MPLKVDAGIPYGNAGAVEVGESGGLPEVRFTADPHGGPECLWFCFRLMASAPSAAGSSVRLVLQHPHNLLGCGRDAAGNLRPVLRREGGDWERLGAPEIEDLPDGRFRLVWTCPAPATFLEVALCYPYGRAELDALVNESNGYWRAEVIGLSQRARPLLRLANAPGEPGGSRPGLYLVARQHSGETPGSWVLDGFLRRLAAAGGPAPLVWAVPLANIDGVEQGDYGKDNFPYDLNRAWGEPPMRHEALVIQRDLRRWARRCRPVLGLDFHAPGGAEADGVYGYLPSPYEHPAQHRESLEWAGAFREALSPGFAAAPFDRLVTYRSRWETPTFVAFFCSAAAAPALALETSYQMAGGEALTR